ncbi:MAG: PAS-domain containing protein [Pseudomonadota bacterium]
MSVIRDQKSSWREDERDFAVGGHLPTVRISADGIIEPSITARLLLKIPDGGALDMASMGAALTTSSGHMFEQKLTQLVEQGRGFRTVVQTRADRMLEAIGVARGFDVVITLIDQTEVQKKVEEARAELSSLSEELDDLRAAQAAAGTATFRAGVLTEGQRAAMPYLAGKQLPEPVERRLVEAAAEGHQRKRVVVPAAETGSTDAAFDLICADRERELFVAQNADSALAAERSMNRLVYTMSETFAHLRVGLMIFDVEKRLSLFNPAIIDIFGDDPEWMSRRPHLRDVLDRMRQSRTLPEQLDFAAWRQRIFDLIDDDQPESYEEIWHLPNGRSLMALFRPHPSGGLAFIVEDITESVALKRTNKAEKAARFATTDILEEGIAVFGPDGRLRMANASFGYIWGIDQKMLERPTHVNEIVMLCAARADAPEFWNKVTGATTLGVGRTVDVQKLALANNSYLSARISPMPDGSTLLVFSDVTATEQVAVALRQRNQALEHADEMRSALIDQISHQMRTPLNSVFGFGQLLSEELIGKLNAVQRDYVQGIIVSSSELLDAINGMADLITIGAEVLEDEEEYLDPALVLVDVVEVATKRFATKDRKVVIVPGAPTHVFTGQRVRLRQIMFNMLMDALTKTDDGGTVTVRIVPAGTDLVLECSHPATAKETEPGLALALVRRFVQLNGGNVDVSHGDDGTRRVRCCVTDVQERKPLKAVEAISDDRTLANRAQ